MPIQVNADRTINTTAARTEAIQATMHGALRRCEVVVTHHAASVMLGVEDATDRLVRVDTALERRRPH